MALKFPEEAVNFKGVSELFIFLRNGETQPAEKREIESWMCKKEESEEVIKQSSEERSSLSKILEEEEEDTEGSGRTQSTTTEEVSEEDVTDTAESIEEFDSECSDVSEEDVMARLEVIEASFRDQTDQLYSDVEVTFWTAAPGTDIPEARHEVDQVHEQLASLKGEIKRKEARIHELQDVAREQEQARARLEQRLGALEEGREVDQQQRFEPPREHRKLEELEQEVLLLRGQHQQLSQHLEEEQKSKAVLEDAVGREQGRVLHLEQRLREQEQSWREGLGASRSPFTN